MNDVAARLANRLRALRKAAGLTQAKLAERAGVRPETVARLERVVRERVSANFNPSIDTLVRLATALGVDIAELFRPLGAGSTGHVADEKRLAVVLARADPTLREKVLRVAELLVLNDPGRIHPGKGRAGASGRPSSAHGKVGGGAGSSGRGKPAGAGRGALASAAKPARRRT